VSGQPAQHEVWFIALDEADPIAVGQAFPAGAEIARHLASADTDDVGARRQTITNAVLRLLLSRWIGIEAALQPFAAGFAGKPQLADAALADTVDFSVSHTGTVALIGLARRGLIGVDIEQPRRVTMREDRRRQIIAVAERVGDASLPNGVEDDAAVLAAWVRLEAVSKATGEGMGRFLTRYRILGPKRDYSEVAQAAAVNETVHVRDLQLPPPYFGAMATTTRGSVATVRVFTSSAQAIGALL